MLQITIPANELWDERNEVFINVKETTLQLEHSLVSLSKWESKWNKPFLTNNNKTTDEILDYIRCMTITQHVDPNIYMAFTSDNIKQVTDYIALPMTATTFSNIKNPAPSREIITTELIYYWMIAFNIPFECQKWHLNRLLTLIKVCNVKNQKPEKMSKSQLMSRNAALNAARRKKLNTRG